MTYIDLDFFFKLAQLFQLMKFIYKNIIQNYCQFNFDIFSKILAKKLYIIFSAKFLLKKL